MSVLRTIFLAPSFSFSTDTFGAPSPVSFVPWTMNIRAKTRQNACISGAPRSAGMRQLSQQSVIIVEAKNELNSEDAIKAQSYHANYVVHIHTREG
ncbi:hypothetical protein CPB85DRAFT_352017 [Mucidula mucida]|nr:hypothetical protein CPB85DRAFT_352017 [Mucidula mucida]